MNGDQPVSDIEDVSRARLEAANECPRVLILSAAEEKGVHLAASRLVHWLTRRDAAHDNQSADLDRLVYTINRRSIHDYRATVTFYDQDDLLAELEVLQHIPIAPQPTAMTGSRVAYVFGGQGAQYHNMGDRKSVV